ncbi:MAG: recombinase family protein, partial [Planctomycetes bacterium]|nr:recombinase family protein [Planctomycetota bacterium]
MKVIGYLYFSTRDRAEDVISLHAQEAKVRAWAELNRASEVVIFRDEGLNEERLEDRPGLQAALNEVGKGDALVCHSLLCLAHQPNDPAISQSTMNMLAIASTLRQKKAKLVSLCEDADEAIFRVYGSIFRKFGLPVDEVPPTKEIHSECKPLFLHGILFLTIAASIIFVISGLCVNNPRLVVVGFAG